MGLGDGAFGAKPQLGGRPTPRKYDYPYAQPAYGVIQVPGLQGGGLENPNLVKEREAKKGKYGPPGSPR